MVGTQLKHFHMQRCEDHAPRTADGRTPPVDP